MPMLVSKSVISRVKADIAATKAKIAKAMTKLKGLEKSLKVMKVSK